MKHLDKVCILNHCCYVNADDYHDKKSRWGSAGSALRRTQYFHCKDKCIWIYLFSYAIQINPCIWSCVWANFTQTRLKKALIEDDLCWAHIIDRLCSVNLLLTHLVFGMTANGPEVQWRETDTKSWCSPFEAPVLSALCYDTHELTSYTASSQTACTVLSQWRNELFDSSILTL